MKIRWDLVRAFLVGASLVLFCWMLIDANNDEFCMPYSNGKKSMMNFGQTNVPYCYDEAYDNSSTCWIREGEPIPFNGSIGIQSGKLTLVAKGSHERVLRARIQTSLAEMWGN